MHIIVNTPFWAWIILMALVFYGVKQIKPRSIHPIKLLIFPSVFSPLALLSLFNSAEPLISTIAFVVGLIGSYIPSHIYFQHNPYITRSGEHWQWKGSYLPLCLYLLIFLSRYFISASQKINAPYISTLGFTILTGLPIGVGLGILVAMALRKES